MTQSAAKQPIPCDDPRSDPDRPECSRISVRDLRYRVPEKEVLRGVSLDAEPGQILCVMGTSGCGKSTLLNCIEGLVAPYGGEIWIGDAQIVGMAEPDLNHVRERMGMVFQYSALFDSLNVFENVAFGLRRRRKLSLDRMRQIVDEKLTMVGLPGTEKLFPSQLSGGMKKRVGLARAIAMEPEILLYDEPTSGLDPVVASMVDELIMEMRDKLRVTSIVVSHNITSIFRISDRVAMLNDGGVQAYGTPDEIKSSQDPIVRQFIEGKPHGPLDVARR